MAISSRQKALLHVAKGQLKLTEEDYRLALVHLAGVTTSLDLDTAGFEALMGFFEWRGFKPLVAQGSNYGNRPGMASIAQLELIRALWREWTDGAGDEGGMNTWLERYHKASSLRFLTRDRAPKVITALKAMKEHHRAAKGKAA